MSCHCYINTKSVRQQMSSEKETNAKSLIIISRPRSYSVDHHYDHDRHLVDRTSTRKHYLLLLLCCSSSSSSFICTNRSFQISTLKGDHPVLVNFLFISDQLVKIEGSVEVHVLCQEILAMNDAKQVWVLRMTMQRRKDRALKLIEYAY